MIIRCGQCKRSLHSSLQQVDDGFQVIEDDEQDAVPLSYYAISDGDLYPQMKDHLILNLDDLAHLPKKKGEYKTRGYGCCGYSHDGGPNLVCFCGTEIGYEFSDCFTPRMACLIPTKITLEK